MSPRTILLSLKCLAALMLMACTLSDCCWPTPCPPGAPVTVYPPAATKVSDWNASAVKGDFASIIEDTGQVIAGGEAVPGYPDAFIYRSVALLAQGDAKTAQRDLLTALDPKFQFTSEYGLQEKILLYRALMVASAKLDDPNGAQNYFNEAVKLAPDQQAAIAQELDSRQLVITELKP